MNGLRIYSSAEGRPSQCRPAPARLALPMRSTSVLGLLVIVVIGVAIAYLIVIMAIGAATAQQPLLMPGDPQPVDLVLEDQFDRKAGLADLRGQVAILVYGDKAATDKCRKLGELLHVCWHPDAKGQPPMKAQAAPVVPLDDLKPGQVSPNVIVVPVACCGKVPGLFRKAIRSEIAKGSPDVVVWLDFEDHLKGTFGLTAGEPNLLVFDSAGRLRKKINGTPDQPTLDKLVKDVQELRYAALKR